MKYYNPIFFPTEKSGRQRKEKPMKIRGLKIIIFLLALLSAALFCGCSNFVVINGIRMKDTEVIEITIGDFSYEGKKIVVEYAGGESREADITEDMIPEAEKLKFYKVGEHEVTANFTLVDSENECLDITELKAKIIIRVVFKGENITFEDKTVDFAFDTKHYLEINGELGEFVSVEYDNNGQMYAGVYEVTARFVPVDDGVIMELTELKATLTINKIEADIIMEDPVEDHVIQAQTDLQYNSDENSITVRDLDTDLYVYEYIHFTYELGGFTCHLWFNPTCSSSTKIDELSQNHPDLVYTYEIIFHYRDENLQNSVTLKVATGKCIYFNLFGLFFERTDDE